VQISALHAICISNRYMFGIGDDYNVEKTAMKIFGAKKIFHTPYSKNTNTLFKRKMSKTFTTLDSHTACEVAFWSHFGTRTMQSDLGWRDSLCCMSPYSP
jgi:hypothetical protein